MSGGEWGEWGHGNLVLPLDDTDSANTTLLELADPALFAAINFLPAVLEIQLGAALRAYLLREGDKTPNAVMTTANIEPVPALYSDRTRFPFFALYRKGENHATHTVTFDKSVAEWEFAYVLPPLMPDVQNRIAPILHAVSRTLGKAMRLGLHPLYESGRDVWSDAGIMSARLVSTKYERYERQLSAGGTTAEQFFRALTGTIEVVERDMPVEDAFLPFTGAYVNTDIQSDSGTLLSNVVTATTELDPTVTNVVPSTGTKAGGTTVTITGTLFAPGPTPRVFIGGAECLTVTRVSATVLTAVTPVHDAYPTYMADVVVTREDGQSGTLSAGFTFTTP